MHACDPMYYSLTCACAHNTRMFGVPQAHGGQVFYPFIFNNLSERSYAMYASSRTWHSSAAAVTTNKKYQDIRLFQQQQTYVCNGRAGGNTNKIAHSLKSQFHTATQEEPKCPSEPSPQEKKLPQSIACVIVCWRVYSTSK